jgi:small subunit ribosomal protein S5
VKRERINADGLELEERVVQINRVSKVVKGGRRFSFSTVVVVGDGKGHVGVGMGKAAEVPEAIRKGTEAAKKNLIRVPLVSATVPHEVLSKYAATKVMLRPAAPGTGVIAGRGVRPVVEAAGIRDLLSKVYGSNNPVNVVKAAFQALSELTSLGEMARRRDMTPQELAGRRTRREAVPAASGPAEEAAA